MKVLEYVENFSVYAVLTEIVTNYIKQHTLIPVTDVCMALFVKKCLIQSCF